MLALYYKKDAEYVGVKAKARESVPGLLLFEDIVSLTMYQCASGKHMNAIPKILSIEEARGIVRDCPMFNALILFKLPRNLVVEFGP